MTARTAVVVLAAVLGFAALAGTLSLNLAQPYPEFIVGHLSWRAETKLQDLIAPPILVAMLVLVYAGGCALTRTWRADDDASGAQELRKLAMLVTSFGLAFAAALVVLKAMAAYDLADFASGRMVRRGEIWPHRAIIGAVVFAMVALVAWRALAKLLPRAAEAGHEHPGLARELVLWSLPVVAALGGLLSASTADAHWVLASAFGSLAVIAVSGLGRRGAAPAAAPGLAAYAVLLLALVPGELALVLGRTAGWWDPALYAVATSACALLGLGALGAAASRRPGRLASALPALLLWAQAGLPLLFLTLVPARITTEDGVAAHYATTPALGVVVGALMAWGWIDLGRRYAASTTTSGALERLVSPVALFALVVAIRLGTTVPPNVSPDDYHFGESVLGAWAYVNGIVPYVGYLPAHGLVGDDLAALVSRLFYDGTAASMGEAARLAAAMLGLAAYLCVYAGTGSLAVAVLSALMLAGNSGWLFLVPFFCLWIGGALARERPGRWLALWLATAPIVILGEPAQGGLALAASAPVAAWCLARVRGRAAFVGLGAVAAAIALLAAATPIGGMLAGALRYVVENGPINQVAWGIPWHESWRSEGRAGLIFEIARMSWIGVVLVTVFAALRARSTGADSSRVLPMVVASLFLLLVIPYSMGRIDPGDLSRAGTVSLFAWAVLLPIALWRGAAPGARAAMLVCIAAFAGALTEGKVSISSLASAVSSDVRTARLVDARSAGLPNVGVANVRSDHWRQIVALQRTLAAHLADGESYLDLSNRNAQYFYTGRLPPTDVSAPVNMVAVAQQRRAVAALSRRPPRLALLEADNVMHDGGSVALRDPVLFRFVLERYVPATENGFVIGLLDAGAVPRTEGELALLDKAFAVRDLRKIPVAWGRSEATLSDRMQRVALLEPAPNARGGVVADLSRLRVSGRDAGLLRFDFSCAGRRGEPRLTVHWWGEGASRSEAASASFAAEDGTLIVPLDAYPRWALLERPVGIAIELADPAACESIRVANPGLYQRKALAAP
ncbi:MAG TPA: hypothetical protein VFB01_05790 [Burkholderiales bacterium]|nr:hypothetical protein [Burkholderiales bacterium]